MTAISANYPQPVTVNGYACKNCTEVDEAKKHIDPAHPKSGPYGINAASDPTRHGAAVKLGGRLAGLEQPTADQDSTDNAATGQLIDIAA